MVLPGLEYRFSGRLSFKEASVQSDLSSVAVYTIRSVVVCTLIIILV